MANVFKPKRSSTASSVPTTSDLADGELAVNSSDQKIYLRDGASVVEVGNVSSNSGGISDIVEDTTPQLGGNLDVNGKNINFGDSASATDDRLMFGANNDLQIYHGAVGVGSTSYIDNNTGNLFIRNNVAGDVNGDIYIQAKAGEQSIVCSEDSYVSLYHNGALKFYTTSSGVIVQGTAVSDGWKVNDNEYLTAGFGDDLKIYHDGSHSYIDVDPDDNNQHLYIRNNVTTDYGGNIYIQARSGENSIACYDDTAVELYYNNSIKLATSSTGITVTGVGIGTWKANDNQYLTAGTGDDLKIYHDGSHSYIDVNPDAANQHLYIRNNVGSDQGGNIYLQAKSGETSIGCFDDSAVALYYDNVQKLQTTSTGITVTGTGLADGWKVNDSEYFTAGTGDDLKIYHDGTNSYIDVDPDATNQHLYIRNNVTTDYGGNIYIQARSGENSILCADDASVVLYYDNVQKLQTTSDGVTINGTLGVTTLAFSDNQTMTFGAGDDLKIYHDGTNSYIDVDPDATNQHLYIRNNVTTDYGGNIYIQARSGENSILCADDASVVLYYDNAQKLQTSTTGIIVSGTGVGDGWKVNDSEYFTAGTGDDFQIYHDGTNTFLDNDTGSVYIRANVAADVSGDIYIQAKSGENSIACFDDSSTRLYFDGVQKLTTTTDGVTINGTLGVTTLAFADNQTMTFGAGDDLAIYHDGTNTYFDNDTGSVYIRGNVAGDVGGDIYIQAKSGENSIACFDDSSTRLYFDGAQKLTTSSTGISVTGVGIGTWKANDNAYITAGTGDDLQIYHDGTNTYFDNDTGSVYIRNNVGGDVNGDIYIQAKSGENSIACFDDSSTRLYFDGAQKLTTSSTGISVTGVGIGTWKANDNAYITAGTGDDFQIYHDGTNTYLDNDTGSIYIRGNVAGDVGGDVYIQSKSGENSIVCLDDSEVRLYYDNAEKLNTSSSGITVTGTATATVGFATATGTSSQFLKADGSVDSSTYLTSYTETDPVVAAINGIVKSDGTTISAATAGTDYLTDISQDTTPQLGGTLNATGYNIEFGDSTNNNDDTLKFGASGDLEICHRGGSNLINVSGSNAVGDLILGNGVDGENVIIRATPLVQGDSNPPVREFFRADGQTGEAMLFYHGSEKLSTNINGISVAGVVTAVSGVVTYYGDGSNLTNLTGASAATYGDSGSTPVIVVDANGRITGISTVAISGGGGGGSTTRTVHRYVATANQTLFPSSGTITYTVGYVDVFLNGTKLDSTEFTATNGTTVTLTTGATVDDVVELIAFSDVSLSGGSGGGNFNELDAALFS